MERQEEGKSSPETIANKVRAVARKWGYSFRILSAEESKGTVEVYVENSESIFFILGANAKILIHQNKEKQDELIEILAGYAEIVRKPPAQLRTHVQQYSSEQMVSHCYCNGRLEHSIKNLSNHPCVIHCVMRKIDKKN